MMFASESTLIDDAILSIKVQDPTRVQLNFHNSWV